MVNNIWVSETPIRDEVSEMLDMDPTRPIHCDWCGLFVTYQIPFDDDVPIMCADCEPEWADEVDTIAAHNRYDDEGPMWMYPPILVAVFEDTIFVDHEGGGTIFTKGDLDRAKADARKTGHAYVDGVPLTEGDVDRIEALFTNIDLGIAPLRCPFCRAVKPCANHDERN